MKIVDVQATVVDAGWRNWVFVLIQSDEGLTGYGECTLEGREQAVVGVIQDFRRHLVGEPVDNIRRLCRQLTRSGYWESGPVISSGVGGVEIALWDLLGKSLGVSVAALLGGTLRDRIPVYSNAWYFGAATAEEFAECARRTVALGYRGLKFDPFGVADFSINEKELGRCIERVEAVRQAVGGDVSLMIEGHGRFGVESALRVLKRLEPLDVRFFEEPTPPGDDEAIGRVATASTVPIAAGERAYDLRACQRLIAAGVSVLQPDIIHLGGISKMVAAAEICEAASVSFAPHNASGLWPRRPPCRWRPSPRRFSCKKCSPLSTPSGSIASPHPQSRSLTATSCYRRDRGSVSGSTQPKWRSIPMWNGISTFSAPARCWPGPPMTEVSPRETAESDHAYEGLSARSVERLGRFHHRPGDRGRRWQQVDVVAGPAVATKKEVYSLPTLDALQDSTRPGPGVDAMVHHDLPIDEDGLDAFRIDGRAVETRRAFQHRDVEHDDVRVRPLPQGPSSLEAEPIRRLT